ERLLREALQGRTTRFFRASTDEALIRVLLTQRKYEEARKLCQERLLNVDDNKFLYRFYLDVAMLHLGKIDEGLRLNEQTVEIAFSEGNKYVARTHRVDLLLQGDRAGEALAECDKLLKEFPKGRYVRDTRFKTAAILSQMKRFADSEKLV